jgi:hypothetical protein
VGCRCKYVNSYLHACLCELLLHFVLGGLNSVECGVAQVIWSFFSWFVAPCWLLFAADFFLIVFYLIYNMLDIHECL